MKHRVSEVLRGGQTVLDVDGELIVGDCDSDACVQHINKHCSFRIGVVSDGA